MSKLLILSAGVSEDSNNTKLAKKLNRFLNEEGIPNEIYENLHKNIPFLLLKDPVTCWYPLGAEAI